MKIPIRTVIVTALIFSSVLAMADKKKTSSECATCVRVENLQKENQEDEFKAYENFNKLLATVKISKNKPMAAAELKSIITAVPTFLENDDRRELPAYLVDLEDRHKEEFAEGLKSLTSEQQQDLKSKMAAARKMLKDGEEP